MVMSGWYVPRAGITAGGGAPQAALPGEVIAVQRGQRAGKKVSLQCSALVVRPPLRDPVPVISGFLHRCSLKRCQLLPTVMVVFMLCLLVIEIRETCGIGVYKERKEEMCMLHCTGCHHKANSLCISFKRKHLAQSNCYMQPYFQIYSEVALEETDSLGFRFWVLCAVACAIVQLLRGSLEV